MSAVFAALYPAGEDAGSVVGAQCRVYRGWPNTPALEADLAAGRVNVSIFPVADSFVLTTRFLDLVSESTGVPTLSVAVSGTAAEFSGSADPGQLAGILVDEAGFAHRTVAGDTPEMVAATLAQAIRDAGHIVRLHGGIVDVASASSVRARVVADGTSYEEVRRQKQRFRISAWCAGPDVRDAVVRTVDAGLAETRFLDLFDGLAPFFVTGTTSHDQAQMASLYRRDLVVSVEYATTRVASLPAMLFGGTVLAGAVRMV